MNCITYYIDTRKLAFEALVVMTDNNAALLRQHEQYMKNVVELSMYYLSLYDDDISFTSKENDADQEYIWNARGWTKDLALKLGGKPFLNIAKPMLQTGLQSTNWKQVYSVLQTFIQLIEEIKNIHGWKIISPDDNDEDKNDDDNNNNKDNNWDILLPKHLV